MHSGPLHYFSAQLIIDKHKLLPYVTLLSELSIECETTFVHLYCLLYETNKHIASRSFSDHGRFNCILIVSVSRKSMIDNLV
jgi:hypothetical protein